MKTAEEFLKEYQEKANKLFRTKVDYRRMIHYTIVISIMDEYLQDYKELISTPEPADMTKELISDIISWEKDLSEYESLETLLRERYIINKRMTESDISGAFESPEIVEEFIKRNDLGERDLNNDILPNTL